MTVLSVRLRRFSSNFFSVSASRELVASSMMLHFEEDWCRIEDRNIQQSLNMFRKFALNLTKLYKSETGSKKALSKIMFDCLLDSSNIIRILHHYFSFKES